MTANQLYALEPVATTHELWALSGCYYNHLEEAGEDQHAWQQKTSERIEIRTIRDHCFDGRRIWKLSTVWFDGKPVMILQNAGREGDDHAKRFITDLDGFKALVTHVISLKDPLENEDYHVLPIDEEAPELTRFYGETLETIPRKL